MTQFLFLNSGVYEADPATRGELARPEREARRCLDAELLRASGRRHGLAGWLLHIQICIYIYVYIHIYMYIYICMYMCKYNVHIYIYLFIYLPVYTCFFEWGGGWRTPLDPADLSTPRWCLVLGKVGLSLVGISRRPAQGTWLPGPSMYRI